MWDYPFRGRIFISTTEHCKLVQRYAIQYRGKLDFLSKIPPISRPTNTSPSDICLSKDWNENAITETISSIEAR